MNFTWCCCCRCSLLEETFDSTSDTFTHQTQLDSLTTSMTQITDTDGTTLGCKMYTSLSDEFLATPVIANQPPCLEVDVSIEFTQLDEDNYCWAVYGQTLDSLTFTPDGLDYLLSYSYETALRHQNYSVTSIIPDPTPREAGDADTDGSSGKIPLRLCAKQSGVVYFWYGDSAHIKYIEGRTGNPLPGFFGSNVVGDWVRTVAVGGSYAASMNTGPWVKWVGSSDPTESFPFETASLNLCSGADPITFGWSYGLTRSQQFIPDVRWETWHIKFRLDRLCINLTPSDSLDC